MSQATSGASNYLLAYVVTRTGTTGDVAGFGVAIATYNLGLGLARSLGSEALTFRRSPGIGVILASQADRGGIIAGGVVAAFAGLGSLLADDAFARKLAVIAFSFLWLGALENRRLIAIAAGASSSALRADLLWLLGMVAVAVWTVGLGGELEPLHSLAIWAALGGFSCVSLRRSLIGRRILSPRGRLGRTLGQRTHPQLLHDRAGIFTIDFLLTVGVVNAGTLLVAGLLPVEAAAELRVAQTIAAPAVMVLSALYVGSVSSIALSVQHDPRGSVLRLSLQLSGVAVVGTAAIGLLPAGLFGALFGASADILAQRTAMAVVAASALLLLGSYPAAALRVAGHERLALVHKATCGPLALGLSAFLALRFGAIGSQVGLATGFAVRAIWGIESVERLRRLTVRPDSEEIGLA